MHSSKKPSKMENHLLKYTEKINLFVTVVLLANTKQMHGFFGRQDTREKDLSVFI